MNSELDLRPDTFPTGVSGSPPGMATAGDAQAIRLLGRAGKVIAPVTVLTALGYHFGREYAHARGEYFGIDVSLFGFSAQDYVVRSLDAVFMPLLIAATAGVFLVAAHSGLVWWSATHSRRPLLISGVTLAATGAAVITLGISALCWQLPYLQDRPTLRYLMPGLGMLILGWGTSLTNRWMSHRERSRRLAEALPPWAASVALGLGLTVVLSSAFAGTTQWARTAGTERSAELARNIDLMPIASVFSNRPLHLESKIDGVAVFPASTDEAAPYRYQYTGLRFYIKSDGKLYFLPELWTQETGRTIVLRDDNSIRLELASGTVDE